MLREFGLTGELWTHAEMFFKIMLGSQLESRINKAHCLYYSQIGDDETDTK